MEKIIDLSKLGHAPSQSIKRLELITEKDHIGVYSIISKWPDSEEQYLRIGFDQNHKIDFVDFDGGPMLCLGDKINDYKIINFLREKDFSDIKIVLSDGISD